MTKVKDTTRRRPPMMSYLERQLPYLQDPQSGANLKLLPTETDGLMLAPVHEPTRRYAIQNGVLQLSTADLSAQSEAYDQRLQAQGWQPLDEVAFRSLPQKIPASWSADYWKQRQLSMAGLWDILERERKEAGRLCVGLQGVVADLTVGLPYVAYGLDAGGYMSFAVSPHQGAYGIGVYSAARYARIHAAWDALPLQTERFDWVILSGSLPNMPDDATRQQALREGRRLLKGGGCLIIMDTPNPEPFMPHLGQLGLSVSSYNPFNAPRSLRERFMSAFDRTTAAPMILVGQLT